MTAFDWKNPDYVPVFRQRSDRLVDLLNKPSLIPELKTFYRENPAQFITDWGTTTDPRNLARKLPGVIPFILFPRQVEWVEWVVDSWHNNRPGVTPKSRESGVSWLAIATACTLCLFNDNLVISFGSRLVRLVDQLGNPDSLLWKAREFTALLPEVFRGKWKRSDAPLMRVGFSNGSVITGEGGDNIGRGGRCGIYFLDEAAHLEHPEITEFSLSSTTNCRMDVSTPRGTGNPFHRKVMNWPPEQVFRFHWRSDPRKDDAWYEKEKAEKDPVIVAQEIDIDFSASMAGIVIPSAWAQAAVDAHLKLGITPTGRRAGALDVADEGRDLNAFCGAHGVVIELLEEWSGKGDDIFGTVQRAFGICDLGNYREFQYDADGLGAGVRGDSRILNQSRPIPLSVIAFRGSGPVHDPEGEDVKGRLNQDFFANSKAQSWWSVRTRFQKTYRWIVEKKACHPDEIISIPSKIKLSDGTYSSKIVDKLLTELSQPTMDFSDVTGKLKIDKTPDGQKSPNLADAVMIRFCVGQRPMKINEDALRRMGIRA